MKNHLAGIRWKRRGAMMLVVVFLMSSCTGAPEETGDSRFTGSLVIAKSDEATSLDPHVHDGWFSVRAQSAAYEGLVDMVWDSEKEEMVFRPLLAKSWDVSPDRKTYTFELEEGVKFHDGSAFTSEDVKDTFERNKAVGLRPSYQVAPVSRIDTPDDHTVVLHLREPWTPFLMAMSRAYIMSSDGIEENDEGDQAQAFFNENMIGTGPYKLSEFRRDSITRLERYEDYWRGWDGKHFDEIVLRHVPESATQRLLIERGEVDFALQAPLDDLDTLAGQDGLVVDSKPTDWAFQLTLKVTGPLADVNVRKALQHAFPYDDFITDVMKGNGTPLDGGPITPGIPGYCPDEVTTYDFDLDKAREFLSKSRYPDGGFDLLLWTFAPIPFEQQAGLMWSNSLRKLNIDMKVKPVASNAIYAEHWTNKSAEPNIYGFLNSTFIPDPDAYLRRWYGTEGIGVLNPSFYSNERVDHLLEKASVTPNGPERDAMYCEMAQIVTEDAIHVNVMRTHNIKVYKDSIRGYEYNPHDSIREFRYWDMYREEEA